MQVKAMIVIAGIWNKTNYLYIIHMAKVTHAYFNNHDEVRQPPPPLLGPLRGADFLPHVCYSQPRGPYGKEGDEDTKEQDENLQKQRHKDGKGWPPYM